MDFDVRPIVDAFLKGSVEAHKRNCAVRGGVRESYELEASCNCEEHWNHAKDWCNRCGKTKEEIVFGR